MFYNDTFIEAQVEAGLQEPQRPQDCLLRVRFTDCSVLSYCLTTYIFLCNGLPKRLQDLADAEGGRLKH